MVFKHNNMIKKKGRFVFNGKTTVKCNPALNNETVLGLWSGHTFTLGAKEFEAVSDLVFKIGEAEALEVGNYAYSLNITEKGVTVAAKTEQNLIYGFMTLLDLIKMNESGDFLEINCCEIKESPLIKRRMIHYCVFHTCELWELERFVKLCGALKYTHIILEFWGMYKFDCLKELAWKEGFTKEQIKPIIKMANDLGIEIIPMINHWGHAASGRVTQGKHVVLSQNLSLGYLFSEDGWCWNYENPRTKALLREMRGELCELCGSGGYFHIGCDEAYGFDFSKDSMDSFCSYINEVAVDLEQNGRKAIMWGDMLISKHAEYDTEAHYETNCPSIECEEYMQKALSKSIVIADWQYNVKAAPVETAITLKNAGFETMLCPWEGRRPISATTQTVKEENLFGFMYTTWHTLKNGMPWVVEAAMRCWSNEPIEVSYHSVIQPITSTVLRKVFFADVYKQSGWSKTEMPE